MADGKGHAMPIDEGALPDLRPRIQRHQQLETDAFCEGCGYNLHGQIVERDERLGLMLCRCPECGRWHAAGKATTASSLWLARLAAVALGLWIIAVIFVTFWICFAFGAAQGIQIDRNTYVIRMAIDGREVEPDPRPGASGFVIRGTTQPSPDWNWMRTALRPEDWSIRPFWDILTGWLLDTIFGVVTGALLVTVMWHWPRRQYALVTLLPFVPAAFVLAMTLGEWDHQYDLVAGWVVRSVLAHAGVQGLSIGAGILLGRPIARGLVRMFIPPRPRQHLAFLWHADGKMMP